MYIADLHIHSRFSRATSRDCDLPHLDWWARRKGIQLIGTGDFTHPAWRAEMREQLVPAGEGVYALREGLTMEGTAPGAAPRFVVTGEISCIYKRHGRTRKVHNLILLPSLEAAEELSVRLEAIGNIHSDGRPILGLDSRDLLELTLETCPEAEFIPAHIWTPHFAMFGAFSGFAGCGQVPSSISLRVLPNFSHRTAIRCVCPSAIVFPTRGMSSFPSFIETWIYVDTMVSHIPGNRLSPANKTIKNRRIDT